MARFAYHGDHEVTRVFGLVFPRGEFVDVVDERAIGKLLRNHEFSHEVDGAEVLPAPCEPPKRRGRPPKNRTE